MINNKAGNNRLQEVVARHPGVRRTETRMSGIPTPGCQHAWDPGVIQLVYIAQIFLEYISFHSFLVL